MTKTYHFMAGLPRSGSTLLSAILNQNPSIYSTAYSDVLELLYTLEDKIPTLQSYKAGLFSKNYESLMRELVGSFYLPTDASVVIDKNRGWGTPYNFTNLSPYLNVNGKVILTMRPILEVLASYVRVTKESEKVTGFNPFFNKDYWGANYRNKEDAFVDMLMAPHEEIDRCIYSVANLLENHGDRTHVVWYDDLVFEPEKTLKSIYDFLDLEAYPHNFTNLKPIDVYDDYNAYGVIGLHNIRQKIEKTSKPYTNFLSEYAISKYKNALDFLPL
jgi:sulfotransferase